MYDTKLEPQTVGHPYCTMNLYMNLSIDVDCTGITVEIYISYVESSPMIIRATNTGAAG